MPKSFGISSVMVASARMFFITEIDLSRSPALKRIFLQSISQFFLRLEIDLGLFL